MSLNADDFPNHWRVVPIDHVAFFQEGPGVRTHQYTESGVKLLNGSNINGGFLDLSKTDRYISDSEAFGKYKHFLVEPGDLLIACSGVVVDKFEGKIAYAEEEHLPLCMNTSTMRFRSLNEDVLYLDYFRRFLQTSFFKTQLQKLITGSAQLNFGPSHIKQMVVPLPPLPEQKRIAAILDKADAIRRKRQQAIQLADDFLRAVFLDMFGDPVTNPKGWETKALADVCKKITDGTHHSPPIVDAGVPYITAKHLKKTGLQFFNDPWFISEEDHRAIYSRCAPEKNDVLYIKDGATTGLAAINEYDFEFSMLSSLALLKPCREKILPEYLTVFLNHPITKQVIIANMAGAAITRLTLAKIKSVRIPVPPIEMQQKFTDIYVKVREATMKITSGVDASVEAFEAISQKAFSGQL